MTTTTAQNATRRLFPDGYDLDAEEKALRHVIYSIFHPALMDPLFFRWSEYFERKMAWERFENGTPMSSQMNGVS